MPQTIKCGNINIVAVSTPGLQYIDNYYKAGAIILSVTVANNYINFTFVAIE